MNNSDLIKLIASYPNINSIIIENEINKPKTWFSSFFDTDNADYTLLEQGETDKAKYFVHANKHKDPKEEIQITLLLQDGELVHSLLKNLEQDNEKVNRLSISGHNIVELNIDISKFTNLKSLTITQSNLKHIPFEIFNLNNIEYLEISNTQIDTVPKNIGQLKNVRRIHLNSNALTSLPGEIGLLSHLSGLNVSNNILTNLPDEIYSLKSLLYLDISDNKFSSLPSEINNLQELLLLNINGNHLNVPPEITRKVTEPQKILSYLLSLSSTINVVSNVVSGLDGRSDFDGRGEYSPSTSIGKLLNEIKVIFIGQGSVGKTSLISRIIHNKYNQREIKTEGISINSLHVDIRGDETDKVLNFQKYFRLGIPHGKANTIIYNELLSSVRLNIWDFGGQEIMHATHQFFLTKRSLYLLVLDSRLTQEENRAEYWLKIIQSFGGESPVLIVGNKIDQHPLDIDRTGLQKKYPNIVGILETSAATGAGIEELKAAITEQVNNLPHVRDLLPETWFTVKTKLEELGRQSNFITHDKYLDLCVENEVSDETSQRTLIGFLHDLGVVLHFQDDPRLEALGILNPQWVTNGVYKILNSHALFQNKGVLTTSMLDEILNLPEYPRGKRLFIVDMMKKFELCYDIEPDKTFLVPDLLPKDEPAELKFNGVPAFEYAYPVLPSSVITRFIVRMNQKIDDGLVWRTGVVLKIGENKALVKADIEDRKITIAIDGVEYSRRDALSAIRYELGEIHNSIKGLNPQQRVPVPNAPLAEPLKYEYLLKLERAGQETVLVENGNDLVTVNVRQMLSAIETEAQRRENTPGSVTTNYFIQGDVNASGDFIGRDKNISAGDRSVVVGGNMTGNLISGNYNKINSAEIDPELKDTLLQLGEAVDAMLQKLPAEQAAEVAEDFGKLADEAVKPKPNQKWYSVSIEGLIKAAENLDKLGTPVISLSQKVLSLLTGGVVK